MHLYITEKNENRMGFSFGIHWKLTIKWNHTETLETFIVWCVCMIFLWMRNKSIRLDVFSVGQQLNTVAMRSQAFNSDPISLLDLYLAVVCPLFTSPIRNQQQKLNGFSFFVSHLFQSGVWLVFCSFCIGKVGQHTELRFGVIANLSIVWSHPKSPIYSKWKRATTTTIYENDCKLQNWKKKKAIWNVACACHRIYPTRLNYHNLVYCSFIVPMEWQRTVTTHNTHSLTRTAVFIVHHIRLR